MDVFDVEKDALRTYAMLDIKGSRKLCWKLQMLLKVLKVIERRIKNDKN